MMRRIVLATSLALALTAAACGGDDGSATTPADVTTGESTEETRSTGYDGEGYGDETDAAGSDDKDAATQTRVELRDSSFAPAELSVKVGDTITFENVGEIAHTATASEGASFDSGSMAAGDRYEWRASEQGQVSYVCDFHPGMEGTITVR